MNIKAYIESGVLEMYALDLLDPAEREEAELLVSMFPELKAELDQIQYSLERYAASQSIHPPARIKAKLQESIVNLEKEEKMDVSNLPLINSFSDHTKWLKLLDGQIPAQPEKNGPYIKVLQKTADTLQMLIVSATDFEDEVHEDLYESFLILSGQCKCTVGSDIRFMSAGEFMAIPLHEHHKVEILSGTVSAILQRISISGQ